MNQDLEEVQKEEMENESGNNRRIRVRLRR
jgi:hypothetical protein